MSESFKIQQNVKVGNDLINLRADNADEFKAIAEWTIANAALFVQVQQALSSVPPSLAGNVSHVAVQEEPQAPAPQQNGGWGAPQQQAPPQFSQPATAGPVCQHGPMVYREGTSAKGPWKGHFCPTPKGTPGQCPPQFAKRG